MPVTVTKRPGRKHYYAWIEGRYVSTGQTDQRVAMQVAARMEAVGVQAYRQGKRTLRNKLPELIEDHLTDLRERDGRDDDHIRKKRMQLMRPVTDGVFRSLKDVKKRPFEQWLNTLECGPKTRSEYLTAWNVFLDWLVYEDRLDENSIKGRIRRPRITREARHTRRALTLDELGRLLEVSAPHDVLYLTAATTGARFKELKLLQWADVHEDDATPHIVLRPETTKNRKGRKPCISAELADALREARTRAKSPLVFRRMPSHHTVDKHIEAAGIAKRTEEGVACFHSLRHTFTTIIARQTGDARLAQRMADHADITTTQRYLHTEREEHAAVMRHFPTLRATGRATPVVQTGDIRSLEVPPCPDSESAVSPSVEGIWPDESEQVVRCLEVEPGGIEPPSRYSQRIASTRVVV